MHDDDEDNDTYTRTPIICTMILTNEMVRCLDFSYLHIYTVCCMLYILYIGIILLLMCNRYETRTNAVSCRVTAHLLQRRT